MMANQVLPSANMNHVPVNGVQLQNSNTDKNNLMDKENLNHAYVTSQMSNLSLGTMNASEIGGDGKLNFKS